VALLSRDRVANAASRTTVAVANRRRLSDGLRRRATFGGARGPSG
jgi:hypothetical protein